MTFQIKSKSTLVLLIISSGGIICGVIAGAIFGLTHDLPQIRSLENFTPSAITRIYSSDKELLAEVFIEKRDPVPLEIIPNHLKAALIATEDRKFYGHSGVDLKAIVRAIFRDIWAGEFVQGASTITQQLAKTLFLTPRKTFVRKMKEALLAFQLERRYTKEEILELYLNQVYFGSGAYGVESAARIFFGNSVKELTLSECALIAGMPKSPSRYSPLVNSDLALKRRNIVLSQMLETDIITEEEFRDAIDQPLRLAEQYINVDKAPYFVEYVKKHLENTIGPASLYKAGLNVFTTLSVELQQVAEQAIKNGLLSLETRMRWRKISNPDPQGALVALEVATGAILALVGGKDFSKSPFNRATAALRQPGSAFKPIVYAYAIEQGFPQNKLILDAPIVFKGAKNGKDWKPQNFSKNFQGEMTLRKALTLSRNIPAVRLIEMLGPVSVAQFGYSLGIGSTLSPNLSLALGSSEVTLMELTAAYSVFPNRGQWIKPFAVLEVIDHRGKVVWRVKPHKKVIMSRSGAAIMTNMLAGVIQEGTGKKARVLGRPVAGKTGTTNEFKDALFIGFSPSITSGIWVGQDTSEPLGSLETGAKAALPIWIEFMMTALSQKPYQYFDIPDDVVPVSINPTTGLPEDQNSSHAVLALFKKGTEPNPKTTHGAGGLN
ncbi:MAG: PBP1A family penicillin-binding protein [Deltaproteobacteria bacterium]|nr:MAG: PBP1A family penicillin-binding protein [Deltaproteobacteria bacterium]